MSAAGEFLPIAKAAEALGISERHARRLADKLPDIDRTPAGHSPLRVSLESLARLAGKTLPTPDTMTGSAGPTPDMSGPGDNALVEHLRGEVEYLRGALDKSQALQLAALGEAAAMRARVEALEKQNRALLEGSEKLKFGDSTQDGDLPPAEGGQNAVSEAQASQSGDSRGGLWAWYRRIWKGKG